MLNDSVTKVRPEGCTVRREDSTSKLRGDVEKRKTVRRTRNKRNRMRKWRRECLCGGEVLIGAIVIKLLGKAGWEIRWVRENLEWTKGYIGIWKLNATENWQWIGIVRERS